MLPQCVLETMFAKWLIVQHLSHLPCPALTCPALPCPLGLLALSIMCCPEWNADRGFDRVATSCHVQNLMLWRTAYPTVRLQPVVTLDLCIRPAKDLVFTYRASHPHAVLHTCNTACISNLTIYSHNQYEYLYCVYQNISSTSIDIWVEALLQVNRKMAAEALLQKVAAEIPAGPDTSNKKRKVLPSVLEDDRFKAMFEDPSFAVDEQADEYKFHHPNAGELWPPYLDSCCDVLHLAAS